MHDQRDVRDADATRRTAIAGSPFGPTVSPFALMKPADAFRAELLGELEAVWIEYERKMRTVPIFERLYGGTFTVDDYKQLLLTLRPQVVEGARWIARVASNCTDDEIRPVFIGHAKEEHLDYQLLERDYVSVGGTRGEIVAATKNVGGDALSGYIFHEASHENAIHLLGAVFIIEGTGDQLMGRWAEQIQRQLGISREQVSFFAYHGGNDEQHVRKMEKVVNSRWMAEVGRRMVKVARVTAALYHLQYSEIGQGGDR